MTPRSIFLGMAVMAWMLSSAAAAPPKQPNIIFILADDLGYADLSCYGAAVKTPHLDRLASNGIRFTHFHAAASICSPSRAAFLTGAYPQRTGLFMGINPKRPAHWFLGLNPDEWTIAEHLREAGYRTHHVGKWHLGTEPEFLPDRHGFDDSYGMLCNYGHSKTFTEDGKTLFKTTPLDRLTRLYTDRVNKIISRESDRPFFIYYAHNYPHTPYKAGKDFAGKSGDGSRGDIMMEFDAGIGEIMKALNDRGIADDTLIIFTSDNGPTQERYAAPYRGTKFTSLEGGHRVPFILHWPARIKKGSVSSEDTHAMDLFPTLSEVAKAQLPKGRTYDGSSMLPLLEGKPMKRAAQAFYYYNCDHLQAVREGDWKLHLPRGPQQLPWWEGNKGLGTFDSPRLYHLKEDQKESRDLSAQRPQEVQRLLAHAERARTALGDYGSPGEERRPVGSVIPDAPAVGHPRDWDKLAPQIRQAADKEWKSRKTSASLAKP